MKIWFRFPDVHKSCSQFCVSVMSARVRWQRDRRMLEAHDTAILTDLMNFHDSGNFVAKNRWQKYLRTLTQDCVLNSTYTSCNRWGRANFCLLVRWGWELSAWIDIILWPISILLDGDGGNKVMVLAGVNLIGCALAAHRKIFYYAYTMLCLI